MSFLIDQIKTCIAQYPKTRQSEAKRLFTDWVMSDKAISLSQFFFMCSELWHCPDHVPPELCREANAKTTGRHAGTCYGAVIQHLFLKQRLRFSADDMYAKSELPRNSDSAGLPQRKDSRR